MGKGGIIGMALLILALMQRIFLMSSLMLLLVWLIFFMVLIKLFFISSRRRHTRLTCDWSSDVCSSDLTWLFTIERRLLLDRRRAEKRRPSRVEVQEGDASTEYDALDSVVAGEAATRVQEALKHLSPTQREVFTLRVAEGLSYKEIADVVGTTEGAARVHYHNA